MRLRITSYNVCYTKLLRVSFRNLDDAERAGLDSCGRPVPGQGEPGQVREADGGGREDEFHSQPHGCERNNFV